jgi:hypothetical protein
VKVLQDPLTRTPEQPDLAVEAVVRLDLRCRMWGEPSQAVAYDTEGVDCSRRLVGKPDLTCRTVCTERHAGYRGADDVEQVRENPPMSGKVIAGESIVGCRAGMAVDCCQGQALVVSAVAKSSKSARGDLPVAVLARDELIFKERMQFPREQLELTRALSHPGEQDESVLVVIARE